MSSTKTKPSLKLATNVKKIDSPLAKYNSAGQLTCIVCNSVVKSEMVWTAHVNGRQHRENVNSLKQPKTEVQFTKPQGIPATKRKADPVALHSESTASPSKKGVPANFFDKPLYTQAPNSIPVKGILKNSAKIQYNPVVTENSRVHDFTTSDDKMETDEELSVSTHTPTEIGTEKQIEPIGVAGALPEGFFDDPKLDAKVRQIEYKDPVEEEWNKFQKEIGEEVTVSVALQEEDQEISTAERQLEEIEEQMLKWGRVIELEQKKQLLDQRLKALRESRTYAKESSEDEDDENAEMDKFFDWRSKAT